MLLIISETHDGFTNEVCEWLKYFGLNFLRINSEDAVEVKYINLYENEINLIINSTIDINLSHIKLVWYRMGYIDFLGKYKLANKHLNGYEIFLNYEATKLNQFVLNSLKEKTVLCNLNSILVNKLDYLIAAVKCGLKVPETIITSYRTIAEKFLVKSKAIVKPIGESMSIFDKKHSYYTYTNNIIKSDLNQSTTFPSLFQSKIDKWIEIRIFFLENFFFSMAIFSQSNNKTSTDYRNHDFDTMNRMVPFKLPNYIKKKIKKLIKIKKVSTGSIDMIIDNNNNYYFIELNTVGNIEMVSKNCNYSIEKIIAENLRDRYYE